MTPEDFDRERPLGGYLLLAGAYAGVVGTMLVAGRRRDLLLERISAADLALLTVGAHRLSRIVSRDKVSRPFRRPFTSVDAEADAPPGELSEHARTGQGSVRRAIGDLLTCTICMDQWTATALMAAFLAAPRTTRTLATLLAMRSGADVLQLAQGRLVRS